MLTEEGVTRADAGGEHKEIAKNAWGDVACVTRHRRRRDLHQTELFTRSGIDHLLQPPIRADICGAGRRLADGPTAAAGLFNVVMSA
jgi:hypothetical protein